MKKLLLAFGLLAGLSGCGSKSEDAKPVADPFLGHWQAEGFRHLGYDKAGKVIVDKQYAQAVTLDITANTITFKGTDGGGKPTTETDTYTVSGEELILNGKTSNDHTYRRNLTATTFTLEFSGTYSTGPYTETYPFHR